MFEINLLPKELRKKKLTLPKINVIQTLVSIITVFVVLHIALSIVVGLNRRSLKRLTAITNQLAPEKKTIDSIKLELGNLNDKLKLANKTSSDRIIWARILNEISDTIPANLWLTQISCQADKSSILITGSVLEKNLDAMAVIGQFVYGLKEKRADIETVNKKNIGGVEVCEFKLICHLK